MRTFCRIFLFVICLLGFTLSQANARFAATSTHTAGGLPASIAQATAIPAAPSSLRGGAFRRGFGEVLTLHWNDNSKNEDSFRIESCSGQLHPLWTDSEGRSECDFNHPRV